MRDELLDRIEQASVLKTGASPHKPLPVLPALGRVLADKRRFALHDPLEAPLKRSLVDFGRLRKVLRSESPFVHLRSGGLREIPGNDWLPLPCHQISCSEPSKGRDRPDFLISARFSYA